MTTTHPPSGTPSAAHEAADGLVLGDRLKHPQHLDDDPLPSGKGWTSIRQFYDFTSVRDCSRWSPSSVRTRLTLAAGSAKSARQSSTTLAARRSPSPT